jgi:very-short-patch-repair endonuclease
VLRKKLRANSTLAERAMWRILWPFRTNGFHFRKQVEIGPYYVDFACHQAQLVIEVDGDTHFDEIASANDETRDDYLTARGFKVLRFTNEQVLKHHQAVFDLVAAALDHDSDTLPASPPPHPSPRGGGCQIESADRQESNT